MTNQETVTITFFHYRGAAEKWWAFKQMGLAQEAMREVAGLRFFKLLGSGGGDGFSVFPNLARYGLLAVWEEAEKATAFFGGHLAFQDFRQKSASYWTVYMRTAMVHGQWDGAEPFQVTQPFDPDRLVGVLTRATIYPRHLWRFWRFVPPVGRSVKGREGLLFTAGIGELPLIQQATFSLWRNSHLMKAYAYQSRYHREVVRRTRELGWYEEELFARFHPYATEGALPEGDPLARYFSSEEKPA